MSSLENGPGYGVNILTMLYVLASKKPPKSYSYKLLITLLPTKQLSNQSSTLAVVFNDSQPLKGTTLKNRIHITLYKKKSMDTNKGNWQQHLHKASYNVKLFD